MDTTLSATVVKSIRWLVMGAILEWVLKTSPAMVTNIDEYGRNMFDVLVDQTVDICIEAVKKGYLQYQGGSVSDLQRDITLHVLQFIDIVKNE